MPSVFLAGPIDPTNEWIGPALHWSSSSKITPDVVLKNNNSKII